MSALPDEVFDDAACASEPIRIPGAIQAHGALLLLSPGDGRILHASRSVETWVGLSAEQVLGQRLEAVVNACTGAGLAAAIQTPLGAQARIAVQTRSGAVATALFHWSGGVLCVELEPALRADATQLFERGSAALLGLQNARDFPSLACACAASIRQLSGFERVMVYRFDEEWNGVVVGEDRDDTADTFMGLHFPASDIPAQARALYAETRSRLIYDSSASPSALVPSRTANDAPIDLSKVSLRSVSPVHMEYLRNMGVGASMSVSLMEGERLWGLVACHNARPKFVPHELRTACEFVGQLFMGEVLSRKARLQAEQQAGRRKGQAVLVEALTGSRDIAASLTSAGGHLLELADATGAVVCLNSQLTRVGKTPGAEALARLLDWLARHTTGDVLAVEELGRLYPPAREFASEASGLLAVPLTGREGRDWALWFRPEQESTVTWAGNPHKSSQPHEGGRLSPRRSFAAWREKVRGKSKKWEHADVEAAAEFRGLMTGVILRHASELQRLNDELARSNEELDAFSYIASHDLKEPLRGIRNYIQFISEDTRGALDADTEKRISLIQGLTERMQRLLDELFHYSRVGRVALAYKPVNFAELLADVLDIIRPRLEETRAHVEVMPGLPTVTCDEVRVREVFTNLLSNAAKYSERETPHILVGVRQREGEPRAFFVQDDGIGIPPNRREDVFEMYRRLHAPEAYGGGTGAGLAIVRQIINKHGGRVWVEETPGGGSTLLFTLQPDAGRPA